MKFAKQEAKEWNHEYIGTEHILLGFTQHANFKFILENIGVDPRKIREELQKILHKGPDINYL